MGTIFSTGTSASLETSASSDTLELSETSASLTSNESNELKELIVNCSNSQRGTILVASILKGRSNLFIISLIHSGCDVNIASRQGERALHQAIYRRTTKVAHELIKYGANLDVLDGDEETPLTRAIVENKLEMAHMLLYYGADVNILTFDFKTALMLAAEGWHFEIFASLIRYYKEYSCITHQQENQIATHLTSMNWFTFCIKCEDTFFLQLSMVCGIPKLFKLIWARLDHRKLLVGRKPFLVAYLDSKLPSFTTSDWLECLDLILKSPCAYKFVEQCRNYKHHYLPELIGAFDKYDVKRNDRIGIFYMLFSLGVEVCCCDIDCVTCHYGFNEEFEACIYAGNYRGKRSDLECDSPFLTFIFGLQQECNQERVFELFKHWPPNISHYNKFFSMCPDMKRELQDSWEERCRSNIMFDTFGKASMFYTSKNTKEVSDMSELPSLLELSRNATQNLIRKNYKNKIRQPYEFHDVVQSMCLPENLKNVLLFKKPIYLCNAKEGPHIDNTMNFQDAIDISSI